MGIRLLTQRQVLDKAGVSKSWLYEGIRQGFFPKPIHPDPNSNAVRWIEHEWDEVLTARIAARDAKASRSTREAEHP
jgi:predicted DNA-binding transcriptional regulator AlpA